MKSKNKYNDSTPPLSETSGERGGELERVESGGRVKRDRFSYADAR